MSKKHWFICEGGIGKHVTFSAIIPKLCKKYGIQRLSIISAYPDIFFNNPLVERSASFEECGLYDDIVNNDDCIYSREPYLSNYVKGKQHIIESYCELFGLEYDTATLPKIFLSDSIRKDVRTFKKDNPKFFIVQFGGGQSPLNVNQHMQHMPQGQIKNYPRVYGQELVDMIREQYPEHSILNYTLPNEEHANIEGTMVLEMPYLMYVGLVRECDGFIAVDSSLQHYSADNFCRKNGVVLWGATGPTQLGYGSNINITNSKSGHDIRPLTRPLGDIYNKDGTPWKSKEMRGMDVVPATVFEAFKEVVKSNEGAK